MDELVIHGDEAIPTETMDDAFVLKPLGTFSFAAELRESSAGSPNTQAAQISGALPPSPGGLPNNAQVRLTVKGS